jgi:DNA-binding Lrp family transcriptional regulator
LFGICLKSNCSECGKKLKFFGGYRHPVEGKRKCVCGNCWTELESSERKYGSFISNALNKKDIGCLCFVLISTKPSFERKVYDKLTILPEIIELHPLLGQYDIIIKIKIDDYKKLENFVLNEIRKINGISDTITLTGTFSLTGMK